MNFEELHLLSAIEAALSNPENRAESSGLNKILSMATAQGLDKDFDTQEDIALLNGILKELTSKTDIQPGDDDSAEVKDYRFLEFYLDGIRYFKKVKNGEPKYGLKMYRKPENNEGYKPNSLILLGGNGIGKSSIFGALQWFCLNEIAEAQLREQADREQYLISSGEKEVKKEWISIVTRNNLGAKDTTTSQQMASLPLSPFFISENDLLQMVAYAPKSENEDWTYFFYRLAGYGTIVKLLDIFNHLLKALNKGITQSPVVDLQTILASDEFQNLGKYLPFALSQGEECLEDILKKIDDLKDKVQTFIIKTQEINTSKEFLGELKQLSTDLASFEAVKEDIAKYYPWEKYIYNALNKLSQPIAESGRPGTVVVLAEGRINELKTTATLLIKDINAFIRLGNDYLSRGKAWCNNIGEGKFDFSSIIKKEGTNQSEIDNLKQLIQQYIDRCNDQLKNLLFKLIDQKFFDDICKFWKDAGLLWEDKTMPRPQEILNPNLKPFESIRLNIKVGDIEEAEAPSKYFNTFRLKLFVLTLRTFLSIRYMQYKNFRFPIIMDDIFYASDFDNKSKLVDFFNSLFDFYKSTSKDANEALQLILLTHDEQIMAASYKALKNQPDVIFGRLYDYHYGGLHDGFSIKSLTSEDTYQNLYVVLHA